MPKAGHILKARANRIEYLMSKCLDGQSSSHEKMYKLVENFKKAIRP